MKDDVCTCPAGRPLGMPHMDECPEKAAEVLVFRQPVTGRPVGVPAEIVSQVERAFRAYQLKLKGMSWESIALQEHWDSGEACAAEVKKYLDEGRTVMAGFKRLEVLALELARYDAMLEGLWDSAVSGKVPAVMAALAISKQRVAVLGLDQPSEDDAITPTVVVPTEEYLAILKKAAKADDAESA